MVRVVAAIGGSFLRADSDFRSTVDWQLFPVHSLVRAHHADASCLELRIGAKLGWDGHQTRRTRRPPINALTRRFYFVYQRETKDVARAAALHAAVLKAIASGDEVAAADAAKAMVDYAEYYTRSVITGRTNV